MAFFWEVRLGEALEPALIRHGVVPRDLWQGLAEGRANGLGVLVSAIFLHGGWLHLLGNMWFLWVFGDNVEGRLGHVRYLFFYLAAGALAFLAQALLEPGSRLPIVGASGAIAGVLGLYMVLFPDARVRTLLLLGIFVLFPKLRAWWFLGWWFVVQAFSATLAQLAGASAHAGGVAWWAHVGGFVVGLLAVKVWPDIRRGPRGGRRRLQRAD
ncbi:MAG: rhomboid family intramembrane serine protease [Candidatus Sericytochromatia bacterium]|nr:rhomboid family intramembrane serine protease [Candidatus Sericytochromatia bacterium]